jgi:hypothetical protein
VTATTAPSWVSDSVATTLEAGRIRLITLVMHASGVGVGLDFVCTSITDHWLQPLTDTSTPWAMAFGDPFVDTTSRQLSLSFDDVVRRTPGYRGSYYLKFQIGVDDGAVTFHPNFNGVSGVDAPNHPALRFDSGRVTLGGDTYAGAGFGTFGAFTGQELVTNTAMVTIYVKAEQRSIAMKVQTDDTAAGSGFQQVSASDVTAPLLVGANNDGSNGRATLTSLVGCDGLTDAQVQAAYSQ